ncbi:hypothetical protein M0R45_011046 [Rubus argutus]|uniref:Uncharacterized protein n=1 Tax=Rubus argutus TaxID=59490 RepID=A0AAW1YAG8_RUBAR
MPPPATFSASFPPLSSPSPKPKLSSVHSRNNTLSTLPRASLASAPLPSFTRNAPSSRKRRRGPKSPKFSSRVVLADLGPSTIREDDKEAQDIVYEAIAAVDGVGTFRSGSDGGGGGLFERSSIDLSKPLEH